MTGNFCPSNGIATGFLAATRNHGIDAGQKRMSDRELQRTFIREWREFRGLSLEELAQAAGMVKGNLSKIERGINPYNQVRLELIARRLDCTPADLLARPPGVAPALESLLNAATPEQQSQLASIAEALIQWRPAPADPAAELDRLVRDVSPRTKRGRPAKKQQAAK
jgi:transcriptional regulator with XRE-family HTH domain